MNSGQKAFPFFSIIIPTYNRKERLLQAVLSVCRQEYYNYEIIVVDDGSSDGTGESMQQFEGNDKIKYYYKENEERSIARNFGIARASGKYIGFLDSDDIMYSNHLSVAHALLQRSNNPEVGHLGYEFVDETGKSVLKRCSFDHTFSETIIHENILHGNAIFIRKDIFEDLQFIPSKSAVLSEDWYLWLRLAARFEFVFDNTITCAVIQHKERSLMNLLPDQVIAATNVLIDYLKRDEVFLNKYRGRVSYHFANHYTLLTLILSLSKNYKRVVMTYLAKAIRCDPSVVLRRRFLATIKHLLIRKSE
ncbi:MAG: glycosyltransferase family A protein [Chryseolinea sp.]